MYCQRLSTVISDQDAFVKAINKANDTLQKAIKKWVKSQGSKYRHGIKDNQNFTKFLTTTIRGGNTDKIEYDRLPSVEYRGRVIKCRRDRNEYNYGRRLVLMDEVDSANVPPYVFYPVCVLK